FSGRGNTRDYRIPKPDLVAPGVGIVAPKRGGGYEPVTGTSFAAPFVTGASALMMEWGIVQGNDPYLYGDKVKAYLRKGAKPILGEIEYPNPRVGYGALCVEDSIPR
ncbi:MAG: S8 family serine peptidase, partial [Lachnospiraceae bacterium]|nr:S8 family serine peptidase [Lachnospiraceae bacterium]